MQSVSVSKARLASAQPRRLQPSLQPIRQPKLRDPAALAAALVAAGHELAAVQPLGRRTLGRPFAEAIADASTVAITASAAASRARAPIRTTP
jgi:hypothetical protein